MVFHDPLYLEGSLKSLKSIHSLLQRITCCRNKAKRHRGLLSNHSKDKHLVMLGDFFVLWTFTITFYAVINLLV